MRAGEYVAYKCKNHLWDVATPLFIGGKHVGNIYTGQFFYDDESIDDRFCSSSRRPNMALTGNRICAALHRVPRISRARVKPLMDFLTKFSALVSRLSFSNLKLAKTMSEQQRIEATLRQSEEAFPGTDRTISRFLGSSLSNQRDDIDYLKRPFPDDLWL